MLRRRRPAATTRRPAWPLITLVALLTLAALAFALGAVITARLTLPERRLDAGVTPAVLGGSYEDLALRSADDRAVLAAWLLGVPASDVGVVLVHGKDGSRSTTWGDGFVRLAVALQDAGYQVVMLDLRGHGASGAGSYAFGFLERFDVIAAVEHLVEERGVRPGQVGVLGVSLGGASAIYAAAIDPRIGAVWSDSAYADIYPIIEQEWPAASGLPLAVLPLVRWTHRLLRGFDLVSVRPVDEVPFLEPRPLMLVHGSADVLVPVAHATILSAAAPWSGVWLLDGVGHAGAYGHDPALYTLRVNEFFDGALRVRLAVGE